MREKEKDLGLVPSLKPVDSEVLAMQANVQQSSMWGNSWSVQSIAPSIEGGELPVLSLPFLLVLIIYNKKGNEMQ